MVPMLYLRSEAHGKTAQFTTQPQTTSIPTFKNTSVAQASDLEHALTLQTMLCEAVLVIKIDARKAHRRLKLLLKDLKHAVAKVDGLAHVNLVGTNGVASAQLYWSRLQDVSHRLLVGLEFGLWWVTYVDDTIALVTASLTARSSTSALPRRRLPNLHPGKRFTSDHAQTGQGISSTRCRA